MLFILRFSKFFLILTIESIIFFYNQIIFYPVLNRFTVTLCEKSRNFINLRKILNCGHDISLDNPVKSVKTVERTSEHIVCDTVHKLVR